jgi:hypothetical protein
LERQDYISLLTHPSQVNKSHQASLEKLVIEHPYCQSAYVLLAKVYQQTGNSSAIGMLRKAALYTSNRALLKQLITPQPEEAYPSVNLLPHKNTTTVEPTTSKEPEDNKTTATSSPTVLEQINQKAVDLNVIEANDQKAQGFIESLYQHLQELSEAKARAAGKLKEEAATQAPVHTSDTNVATPSEQIIEIEKTPSVSQANTEEKHLLDPTSSNEIGSFLQNIQNTQSTTSNENKKSDVLDLLLGFDSQIKDYFDLNTYTLKETPPIHSHSSETSETVEASTLPFNTTAWELNESRMEEVSLPNNDLLLNYLNYISTEKQKKKQTSINKEALLIKKFIKEEPSIAKNTYPLENQDDTSMDDGIEATEELPEAYINENFAKTLTLQKNYSQAILVYEALILKNPEKKSYFAHLIEELKLKK